MISKRFVVMLSISCVWWFEGNWCDSNIGGITTENGLSNGDGRILPTAPPSMETFRAMADFILRLNELIKHLATSSLDDTLGSRTVIEQAGHMWTHTETMLDALVRRTEPFYGLRTSNVTAYPLHDALDAVRTERDNFFRRVHQTDEIDSLSIIDRDRYDDDEEELPVSDSSLTLIMHTSVHGLTTVTADLLRSMEGSMPPAQDSDTGHARATPTKPTVDMFLAGFKRLTRDTRRNFRTQSKRVVRRVEWLLSDLEPNSKLSMYLKKMEKRWKQFRMDVRDLLKTMYDSVKHSMTKYGTAIDDRLSSGISGLLMQVANYNEYDSLHVCLKRYVFKYFDQSLAVAKLLYCGQQEITTLEYLDTVTRTVLDFAAIADSRPIQMNVVCGMDHTNCTDHFYDTLQQRYKFLSNRVDAYTNFTQQELLYLAKRVEICDNSTAYDIQDYANAIDEKFGTCLQTGSAN